MADSISTDPFQQLQGEILEAIARGTSLRTVCELVCRCAEELAAGVVCSILAVDASGVLHPLAGPGLSERYTEGLEGIVIGPCVGSCGTAAWRGEPVEVRDLETDPLWADYKSPALAEGLKACWSSPIKAANGRVVGVFAFYYRESRGPSELERRIVERCVNLCAIAIEQDEVQARIHQLAFFDSLTGLPNRAHFQRRAADILESLGRGQVANVLYIDLDDFKGVNDTLGHRVGDQLLECVAERLSACMDADAFVARLGGDEFAVIQAPVEAGQREGALLAHKIIAVLEEPFDIGEQRIAIGASVGIAQSGATPMHLAELSKRADMALYEAKSEGRKTYRFFSSEMEAAARSRRDLKEDLRAAIAKGGFRLVYQPIMTLETNELVAVEALLRWDHPLHGPISPAVFIPVAEEIGLIGQLGDWVLREACVTAASWPRDIKVGVNLSPLQFRKPGFVLDVVSALHQAGLPPERLDLEVTESAVLARDVATRTALHELHDYGIRLSLDDFGTGYSSLQSLRWFPFDRIKIDMSFVSDIGMDADSTAIIHSIIRLAGDLGMKTTAEGIETEDQAEWLANHGCSEGQGYWFSRPMSAADLQALLESPRRNEELIVRSAARPMQQAAG